MKRLWNSSLVTKIFLSYLAVIALLFLGLYYSSNALLRNFYIDSLSERMEQEAHLLARVVPFDLSRRHSRRCLPPTRRRARLTHHSNRS